MSRARPAWLSPTLLGATALVSSGVLFLIWFALNFQCRMCALRPFTSVEQYVTRTYRSAALTHVIGAALFGALAGCIPGAVLREMSLHRSAGFVMPASFLGLPGIWGVWFQTWRLGRTVLGLIKASLRRSWMDTLSVRVSRAHTWSFSWHVGAYLDVAGITHRSLLVIEDAPAAQRALLSPALLEPFLMSDDADLRARAFRLLAPAAADVMAKPPWYGRRSPVFPLSRVASHTSPV